MKSKPLISVVTVSYNAVATIEQTILSVINQTYINIEYIIIDGGSTDGTVDIIKKYADKITYWVSEPDNGIYDAMNKGILQAKGSYIGLLNSDDWYNLNTIENVVKYITSNNVIADVIYGNIIYETNPPKSAIATYTRTNILDSMTLFHPSVFVRKEIYEKHLYDINYSIVADWDFFVKITLDNATFYHLNEYLAHFRVIGISQKVSFRHVLEKNRIRFKYNRGIKKYGLLLKDITVYLLEKNGLHSILLFLVRMKQAFKHSLFI